MKKLILTLATAAAAMGIVGCSDSGTESKPAVYHVELSNNCTDLKAYFNGTAQLVFNSCQDVYDIYYNLANKCPLLDLNYNNLSASEMEKTVGVNSLSVPQRQFFDEMIDECGAYLAVFESKSHDYVYMYVEQTGDGRGHL